MTHVIELNTQIRLAVSNEGQCIRMSGKDHSPLLFRSLKGTVRQLSSSDDHTSIVTDTGDLYMFGDCRWEKLGPGVSQNKRVTSPKLIPKEVFQGKSVLMASCGGNHTAIVTECGCVYTFGMDFYGSLFAGSMFKQIPPSDFDDEKVVMVASATAKTFAVTDNGRVFFWGSKIFGSDVENRPVAISEGFMDSDHIVFVSACMFNVAAISRVGRLYTWGRNCWGQLGHGDKIGDSGVTIPTLVDSGAFNGSKVIMASCHFGETAVVTEDGNLWISGNDNLWRGARGNFLFWRKRSTFEKIQVNTAFGKVDTKITTVQYSRNGIAFALTRQGILLEVIRQINSDGMGFQVMERWEPFSKNRKSFVVGKCSRLHAHEIAFLMGTHKRLGAQSPINILVGKVELIQHILGWYRSSKWIRELRSKSEGLARLVGGGI